LARHFLKKISYSKKFNDFLEKKKLPKAYFAITRRAITRGLLVGFFWGFIPMPMQMGGVMLTTPFFKFNVPLALATVWLSNPITYPFMFYMEYLTGNLILGKESLQNIELTMDWFTNHWSDIAVSMYVGAAFWATVGSYTIYLIVNWLWIRSVKRDLKKKNKKKSA
jgi:uncharacterized protein (DUF2062 family)